MNEESILKLNKWFAGKYHIEWASMHRTNNDLSKFINSMPQDILRDFIDNPEVLKVHTSQDPDSVKVDVWLNPFFLMMERLDNHRKFFLIADIIIAVIFIGLF
jgi:hypothetical protein